MEKIGSKPRVDGYFNRRVSGEIGLHEAIIMNRIHAMVCIAEDNEWETHLANDKYWHIESFDEFKDYFYGAICLRSFKNLIKKLHADGYIEKRFFKTATCPKVCGYRPTQKYLDLQSNSADSAPPIDESNSADSAPPIVHDLHQSKCNICTTPVQNVHDSTLLEELKEYRRVIEELKSNLSATPPSESAKQPIKKKTSKKKSKPKLKPAPKPEIIKIADDWFEWAKSKSKATKHNRDKFRDAVNNMHLKGNAKIHEIESVFQMLKRECNKPDVKGVFNIGHRFKSPVGWEKIWGNGLSKLDTALEHLDMEEKSHAKPNEWDGHRGTIEQYTLADGSTIEAERPW